MDASPEANDILDIAVGVLVAPDGRFLIAQRRPGTPGAGRWEFPGGKQEPGETVENALQRELAEEIGVHDCVGEPIIRFAHALGPRPVRLHVWRVERWAGDVHGREGQRMRWATRAELGDVDLLPATDAILQALFLPRRYLITPTLGWQGETAWKASFEAALNRGARLVRLRDHDLDDSAYRALAAWAVSRAHAAGARLLIDRDVAMQKAVGADGLHWSADRLCANGRPGIARDQLLAVSAHDGRMLAQACSLGADFAVLSPVRATRSHPQAEPLGWHRWVVERGDHALPVYALGGLTDDDIETARSHNGQGIAAIRGLWPLPDRD